MSTKQNQKLKHYIKNLNFIICGEILGFKKGKKMEKGKVIFAIIIFALLMAMAITVLIVNDVSYKREKKEYFQETREKLQILKPENQAVIGKKTYSLN